MHAGWWERWLRRARGAAVAFAVVLLLAACSAQPPARGAAASSRQAGPAGRVVALTGISVLRSVFNHDRGHARLVLILSPT